MPTIAEVLQQWPSRLTSSSTPSLDCRLLLQYILQKHHAWLISYDDYELTAHEWQRFLDVFSRREQGIPIAYITGEREFWGLSLSVTPDVLIPRADTETLIDAVLQFVKTLPIKKALSILDLGTGSGAIALALASELKDARVYASDISANSLKIAQQNAQQLGLEHIEFIQSNWFENINADYFDIIVSNPPYIDADDENLSNDGVKYEPIHALVSAKNGLADIECLLEHARNYMHKDSRLFIEHGYDQVEQVGNRFQHFGYQNIQLSKDLAGHGRVTSGQY